MQILFASFLYIEIFLKNVQIKQLLVTTQLNMQ